MNTQMPIMVMPMSVTTMPNVMPYTNQSMTGALMPYTNQSMTGALMPYTNQSMSGALMPYTNQRMTSTSVPYAAKSTMSKSWYKNPSEMNLYTSNNYTSSSSNFDTNSTAYLNQSTTSLTHNKVSSVPLPPLSEDKPIQVLDPNNVPVDTISSLVKLPASEIEETEIINRESWTEDQKTLGFSTGKIKVALIILFTILGLTGVGLVVAVVLYVIDSGTDYEWKLFGIISTSAIIFFSLAALMFVLCYAKMKYDDYKETLESQEGADPNVDEYGRIAKPAVLSKIYRYVVKKPKPIAMPKQVVSVQPQMLTQQQQPQLATYFDPTPTPTIQPVIKTPIKPKIVSVRRVEPAPIVEFESDDEDQQNASNVIFKVKTKRKQPIIKTFLQKIKRKTSPQREIIIKEIKSNYVGDAEVVDNRIQSPGGVKLKTLSPSMSSHRLIPYDEPKVIKVSKAPESPEQSKFRLVVKSETPGPTNRKPVILNKNIGEDLNAFD